MNLILAMIVLLNSWFSCAQYMEDPLTPYLKQAAAASDPGKALLPCQAACLRLEASPAVLRTQVLRTESDSLNRGYFRGSSRCAYLRDTIRQSNDSGAALERQVEAYALASSDLFALNCRLWLGTGLLTALGIRNLTGTRRDSRAPEEIEPQG
jgi:hypothetical protein